MLAEFGRVDLEPTEFVCDLCGMRRHSSRHVDSALANDGGETGPDFMNSDLVAGDVRGEKIGPRRAIRFAPTIPISRGSDVHSAVYG